MNSDVKSKTDNTSNNTTEQTEINTMPTNVPTVIEREFEIAVYDISIDDTTGKEITKPVLFEKPLIITASSPVELNSKLNMYKSTGQIAKVVREVTKNIPVYKPENNNQSTSNNVQQTISNVKQSKPKYFKVGDIEVKDDNGKIYQKQWVKLTTTESSNIRIINDKNNSIFNLKDKHIEIKKWILIENIKDSDIDNVDLEDNL